MEGSPATLARSLTTLPQAVGQEKAVGKKKKKKKEENTHILPHFKAQISLAARHFYLYLKAFYLSLKCFRFSFVMSKLITCSAFNKKPSHTDFCLQNLTSCMHKILTSRMKLPNSRQKRYRTTFDRLCRTLH